MVDNFGDKRRTHFLKLKLVARAFIGTKDIVVTIDIRIPNVSVSPKCLTQTGNTTLAKY